MKGRQAKTWKTWTFKEEQRLIDLRAQGLTLPQCAAALNRSLPSVKCRVVGMDAPKHNLRQTEYVLMLTTPGLSNRQMAERLRVKRHTVIVMKKRIRRRMSRQSV